MDQKFIDNSSLKEIQKIKREIEIMQNSIRDMQEKVHTMQENCNHIFMETSIMRVCQKCGFSESMYY